MKILMRDKYDPTHTYTYVVLCKCGAWGEAFTSAILGDEEIICGVCKQVIR